MPYQPSNIWLSPWNGQDWVKSAGKEQYRRALYTYWKRTAPYPSMISFDGTAREVCTARRIRTNTPLQALVLLNDSVYWEAAGHLAAKMKESGSVAAGIGKGYEMIMLKPMSPEKMGALMRLYEKAAATKEDPMTVVASAMLNLDEVVTKN